MKDGKKEDFEVETILKDKIGDDDRTGELKGKKVKAVGDKGKENHSPPLFKPQRLTDRRTLGDCKNWIEAGCMDRGGWIREKRNGRRIDFNPLKDIKCKTQLFKIGRAHV